MQVADIILNRLKGRKVLILGFGREGASSYAEIRRVLPGQRLTIADKREKVREDPLVKNDPCLDFCLGKEYLEGLDSFDIIVKTPGITLKDHPVPAEKITSQTGLFLEAYSKQVIGITGTKGKSTTATLLWHILKKEGRDVLLLGNIGRPAFGCLDKMTPETMAVYEMSSHQLEYIDTAPQTAVLLNIFREHLDAYRSFGEYRKAKMNICRNQVERDSFIYHCDDPLILQEMLEKPPVSREFPFSLSREVNTGSFVRDNRIRFRSHGKETEVYDLGTHRKLRGEHNVKNILAAVNVCMIHGIPVETIAEGITEFKGLEHRLQYAGTYGGVEFYDDSISTIPEACIEAVKTLGNVDTLILGGYDRGIDYSGLAGFLAGSTVTNFIFTGEAGERIRSEVEKLDITGKRLFSIRRFDEFPAIAGLYTAKGKTCLLSPAAASYDEFRNFEERGNRFRELVKSMSFDDKNGIHPL